MARRVTAIPATINRFTEQPINSKKKRRVAGYARVSTDHEDQVTSYEAQVDYYTNYIQGRADWEFAGMYTDEGITATSTKYREGFKQMIEDAIAGKIDLIITKSVSRFARNTVDSLTTIRNLKENNVECYFEKENIWTFDSKGELLLTIMSSLAQEEARSISENTTWGQRKRFADGKARVPYSRFLGYDKGPDGIMVVVPEQAETVRLIYRLFLEGKTLYGICRYLEKHGIKTPAGKEKWGQPVVRSILTNEKYKGDALLQKKYTVDFLSKKVKVNEGEVPQYYVENDHEAIIDPETFDLVQMELEKRKGNKFSGSSLFSSKIECAECGNWYGSKIWHSTDKYRRTIYQCNYKYGKKHICTTPHLTEDEIKDIAVKGINKAISEKEELIANMEVVLAALDCDEELKAKQAAVAAEMEVTVGLTQAAVTENAHRAQDQNEYAVRYNALVEQYEKQKAEYESIGQEIVIACSRRKLLNNVKSAIEKQQLLEEFDETVWNALVEKIRVASKKDITIIFKDGSEIKLEI